MNLKGSKEEYWETLKGGKERGNVVIALNVNVLKIKRKRSLIPQPLILSCCVVVLWFKFEMYIYIKRIKFGEK